MVLMTSPLAGAHMIGVVGERAPHPDFFMKQAVNPTAPAWHWLEFSHPGKYTLPVLCRRRPATRCMIRCGPFGLNQIILAFATIEIQPPSPSNAPLTIKFVHPAGTFCVGWLFLPTASASWVALRQSLSLTPLRSLPDGIPSVLPYDLRGANGGAAASEWATGTASWCMKTCSLSGPDRLGTKYAANWGCRCWHEPRRCRVLGKSRIAHW
jgi:hypothetical protein